MSKILKAKITSKNQVTLPLIVVQTLGIQAGDTLRFEIDDGGVVTVIPPSLTERLRPWVGFLRRNGRQRTQNERDAFVRDMRGDVDE